jgi:prepilin-type N-terminal cleavage/methylation domain-containing protein
VLDVAGQPGFTLVELLSVMAIMTIVLSIAVGAAMDWGRGTGMRGAARNVKSSLDLARQWAMTRGVTTTFLCGNAVSAGRGYFLITNAFGMFGNTNYVAQGVGFAAGATARIDFLPDGSCAGADAEWPNGCAALVLRELSRGEAGLSATVRVYRTTGYARTER